MKESNVHGDPTLRSLREGKELSRPALGRRINVSDGAIQAWEEGKKVPRFDNALALAKELGVSLKVLAKSMNLNTVDIPDD
ncbi:MAG TPA: helix-turn-helix transcriptional regulator [Candidatus Obscuribacterales bacterium]